MDNSTLPEIAWTWVPGIAQSLIAAGISGLLGIAFVWGVCRFLKPCPTACGVYRCEYEIPWYPDKTKVIYEVIVVISIFKRYYGFLVNEPSGDPAYRKVERVCRRIITYDAYASFLVGTWYDPYYDEKKPVYGCFMIQLDERWVASGGWWTGYSKSLSAVSGGPWRWRIDNGLKYNMIRLLFELLCRKKPMPGVR